MLWNDIQACARRILGLQDFGKDFRFHRDATDVDLKALSRWEYWPFYISVLLVVVFFTFIFTLAYREIICNRVF